MRKIVVGVDDAPDAQVVLSWAADEARRRGGELEVVNAWKPAARSAVRSTPAPPEPFDGGPVTVLERVLQTVDVHGIEVHPHAVATNPIEALMRASEDADLLVVGSRRLQRIAGLVRRSVGEHAVTHAPCPVAVIPHGWSDPEFAGQAPSRVVVGVDGSLGSRVALEWAYEEATARRWPLVPVMAWTYLDQHHPGGDDTFHPTYKRSEAEAALDEIIDEVGAPFDVETLPLTPCEVRDVALLDEVHPQDLLVVGSRGHQLLASLVLDSVSLRCATEASCPTVVVRSTGEPSPAAG